MKRTSLSSALFAAGLLLAFCALAWSQISTTRSAPRFGPGYLTGRFYPTGDFQIITTNAVPTLDTVVFVYPWIPKDDPLTAVSLSVRAVTGVASCSIKFAVWQGSIRPTGVPVVGSNTGQSCATSATSPLVAVSYTFQPGIVYWIGTAVSTGATQFYSCNVAAAMGQGVWGQLGMSSNVSATACGLSAPYTFATDITTLNLTGATFTDIATSGVPQVKIGT